MNRLEVKTSKVTLVCAVLLGLIIVPLALGNIYQAVSRGRIVAPLLIGVPLLALLGSVLWIARRGHLRSVKCFNEEGLMLNDGRTFAWPDLSCVVDQIHRRRGMSGDFIWRTEIHFKDSESAWLIPRKIANYKEVSDYVDRLPCDHTTVRV